MPRVGIELGSVGLATRTLNLKAKRKGGSIRQKTHCRSAHLYLAGNGVSGGRHTRLYAYPDAGNGWPENQIEETASLSREPSRVQRCAHYSLEWHLIGHGVFSL